MQITQTSFGDGIPIDSYGPGFFRIQGEVITGNLCLSPCGVAGWQGYGDHEPLLALGDAVDILFLGTGAQTAHVPASLRAALEGAGLLVEGMNTPAACRTYNVLLSEGRRVGAALLAI